MRFVIVARRALALIVLAAASGVAGADVSPNWFRSPSISPDGRTVVFTHGGDLYRAPIEGGRATPITIHPAYETSPVWSHDGQRIAFASDRNGNFDVYVMPSEGGEATRLTWHSAGDTPTDFTPDDRAVIFESSRLDSVDSALFPSGVLSELYSVPVTGGAPQMILTTPALNARFDAEGERLLYEDRKGYEDPYRKRHTSSIARDIWVYDASDGSHTKLTDFAGEDRDPQWSEDERAFYFLSEREGDFNVFRAPLRAGADAEQLTEFEHHPVRDLDRSEAGVLVFSWHGEIYSMTPGERARRIPIEIGVDAPGDEPGGRTERSGATEFAVAPSGKEIAFIVRGEVFVTSTEFGTTRRITNTPEQERSVGFSPDGRTLVYASERDGSWSLYTSSMIDEDELYFFSATKIEEEPLLDSRAEEFQPLYSPDGKKVAYLHNRSRIKVLDVESGDTTTVLPGDAFYSYSDGDHWFRWSPDGQWLAVHFYNRGRAFVAEVGLVPADGSQTDPIDLSKSGYDDQRPHWAMEGGAIIWATDRYGERSHGSWGAEYDVVGAFLTRDAYDRFTLSKEEYELQKEQEEKRKKDEEKEDDAENGEGEGERDENGDDAGDDAETGEEEDGVEPVEIELDGIESRTLRLTIHASALGDFEMTPEADRLFYLARFEGGYDLWVHEFRENSTRIFKKLNANSASMTLSGDGSTIFMLANGSLSKIDAKSGEQTPIAFGADLEIHGDTERAHLFEHVWRQTKQKFYRPDMHGVDWEFYREQYEPKLAGLNNNRDFAIVLSEMLGELNASHTGGRYFDQREDGDASTASLGVFYDTERRGSGVRIAEIMEGGPLDKAELDIEPGMIITEIDAEPIDANRSFHALLDGKAGDRVRLTLRTGDGGTIERVVKPVSLGRENQLRYERWVRQRRAIVDEASDGRLGYVHVRGMNDPSFREFYSEVLGRHFDKEGLIVDTRFNGGGWLHDDLVTFLSGERYVDLYPRDDESPDVKYLGDTSRRWTKPSIVVMSESNYSDAHFFPWAYTELGIGDTVGMPVPGTATAVWWERLHTGDIVFGIPQVGTKGEDGRYLENQQLEPTHQVPLDPVSAAEGRDTQVLESVRVLLGADRRGATRQVIREAGSGAIGRAACPAGAKHRSARRSGERLAGNPRASRLG